MLLDANDSEPKSTITVLQEVRSPSIPADAHVLTVLINHPPGAPETRHIGFPADRDSGT